MKSTKLLTDIAGLLALCASLWYALHPTAYAMFIAANAVFMVATVYAAFRATPEERRRNRPATWLAPIGAAVVAALWVSDAAPEDRMRALVMAGGLVIAAGIIVWARRHST